jgi:hypothetical protein
MRGVRTTYLEPLTRTVSNDQGVQILPDAVAAKNESYFMAPDLELRRERDPLVWGLLCSLTTLEQTKDLLQHKRFVQQDNVFAT